MDIIEIKRQSPEDLKGKWPYVCIISLVFIAINTFITYILKDNDLYYNLVRIFIISGLELGLYYFFMNVKKGKFDASDIFKRFNLLPKAIIITVILNISSGLYYIRYDLLKSYQEPYMNILYILLVLFILFYCLRFSLSYYILLDNPKMSIFGILNTSNKMMKGNIFKYIGLFLSFFPWLLVIIFTFGLGLLYVYPYMQMSQINFYYNLKGR
jgi:uncharacterized membrane protein